MSEVVLKGGPMEGRTMNIVGYGTKVALGHEYGWKFACGQSSYANGMYLPDGSWQDAERDVTLAEVCAQCEEYGTHDLEIDPYALFVGIGEDDE
jgi:hypothetical protein